MFKSAAAFLATLSIFGGALAQSTSSDYGQCGGIGWTGATLCPSGWSCNVVNSYYFQCLPGAATSTPPTTTSTTSTAGSGSGTPTSSTTAVGGTATLQSGYSWIRSVEDPNFHKYLRSEVMFTATSAVLGDPDDAAQFVITNGQLIQNANGTNLYAVVQPQANSTVTKLLMSWSTSPSTDGSTFMASGDTIEWSIPTITRPQLNAWLVCPDTAGNNLLYVNLGAYDYMTPAGCADETIHYYTGSTASARGIMVPDERY